MGFVWVASAILVICCVGSLVEKETDVATFGIECQTDVVIARRIEFRSNGTELSAIATIKTINQRRICRVFTILY